MPIVFFVRHQGTVFIQYRMGVYIDNEFEAEVRFGTDTFYIKESDEEAIAYFEISGDTFRIRDLPGLSPCTDWGVYLYRYSGSKDTLAFDVVSDTCDFRVESLDVAVLVLQRSSKVFDLTSNITLGPNPTNGQFSLKFDGSVSDMRLSIVDVNGRNYPMEYTREAEKITVDLQAPNGIYFLNMITSEGVIRGVKLVVSN